MERRGVKRHLHYLQESRRAKMQKTLEIVAASFGLAKKMFHEECTTVDSLDGRDVQAERCCKLEKRFMRCAREGEGGKILE